LYAIVDGMNRHMGNQAMQAVGVSEASISQAIEYTSSTIRWDHPLVEYQGVHFPIADMWVDAEASRAISCKANQLYDAGDEDAKHGKWSILAFRQAATAAIDACRKTIELMGARAIEREEGWNMELMYRDTERPTSTGNSSPPIWCAGGSRPLKAGIHYPSRREARLESRRASLLHLRRSLSR